MRVAFIYPSLTQRGGAETHLLTAAALLAERGHSVRIITSAHNTGLYPRFQSAAFEIKTLGGRGLMEGIGGTLRLIARLPRHIQDADVVVPVNFPASAWTLGVTSAPLVWLLLEPKRDLYPNVMYREAPGFRPHQYRRAADYQGIDGWLRLALRDPHVLLPYGARAWLQRQLDQTAARRMTLISANSPYTAEKARALYPYARIEISYAPLIIPPLANAPTEHLIVVPTRLEPIKNVEVVLRAAALLQSSGALVDWRIWIIGTGSDEARLRTLALKLGLGAAVRFTGYITDDERDSAYERCAFVVYPTLAEPLGLPPAEAGLRGKAVIASNAGGTVHLIEDGVTGRLVAMTDANTLAAAMRELMQAPDLVAQLGAMARQKLLPLVGASAWVQRFEEQLRLATLPQSA